VRIGLDARLLRIPRGIGGSVSSLLIGLSGTDHRHEFIVYVDSEAAARRVPMDPRFTIRLIHSPYPIWEQVRLPFAALEDRLDILHCPGNTAPTWAMGHAQLVVTIHDVIFLTGRFNRGNSFRQKLQNAYYGAIVPRIARRAAVIVTDSLFSKHDIATRLKIDHRKIVVIHLAVGPHFQVSDPEATELVQAVTGGRPYIIAPAAEDPRKNTARLIHAFKSASERIGEPYLLVLVGMNNEASHRFKLISKNLGIEGRVRFLGFVSEDYLVKLYKGASFAAYPSLYEGFGLPVLEAMACGTAVIASNTTAIPEIAGDAALLVNPESSEELTDAIERFANDPTLRERYITLGKERSKMFSLSRFVSQTLALYESLASVSQR